MTKSSRLEEDKNIEDNIINCAKNLLRLKKLKNERNNTAIKDKRNFVKLKDRIHRDIRNLFEHEDVTNLFR